MSQSDKCFNPRPREGGDTWDADDNAINKVSIHAPAKGATPSRPLRFRHSLCFNPRPREGGDLQRCGLKRPLLCFNPRPREGGDTQDVSY